MSKESILINFYEANSESLIVNIVINDKNENFSFGICEFENEMELLDFPTKLGCINEVSGFIFDRDIDKELLKKVIERFAIKYDFI